MQTVIKVRCGKPILKLKYRTLKGIQICAVIIYVVMLLYCLNLFTMAVRLATTVSIYISLVSNNGIVFPGLISLAGLICVFVNGFAIYYLAKAFDGTKNKYIGHLLFMFIIVCSIVIFLLYLICIFLLLHTYSSHEELHDGIMAAMKNYSKDSLVKAKLDMMQIENACCGSKNYSDWYSIKWYDANLINTEVYPQLEGETPFSCCSIKSVYPCIHHGVELPSNAYIYTKDANISVSTEGCHSIILKVKKSTGWMLVFRTLILVSLQVIILTCLRLIQTAHTESKSLDREDKLYTCWLIGCYGGKVKYITPPPVPPIPPEMEHDDAEEEEEVEKGVRKR